MEEREVVGAVDIDEGDAVAEFDRPRPGLLFEHFEGKDIVGQGQCVTVSPRYRHSGYLLKIHFLGPSLSRAYTLYPDMPYMDLSWCRLRTNKGSFTVMLISLSIGTCIS